MTLYDQFFDKVLSRTDPEVAHHAAFRAIRAAAPLIFQSWTDCHWCDY